MTILIGWVLMGISGHWIVLKAYKKLTGEVTVGRYIQQLPVVILGPFGVLFGLVLHIDLHFDNPRTPEKPGWWNKRVM